MVYSGLSYPGSKRRVMNRLLPLFPDGIEDWREPFFGSGAVTLAFLQSDKSKDCKRLLVGDLAPEIWAYHVGCRDKAEEAVEVAKLWFTSIVPSHKELVCMDINDDGYEELRGKVIKEGLELWRRMQEVDTSKLSIAERCARTFLVNRISFSGMGDSGSMSKDQLCKFRLEHTKKILDVSPLLQRVEIVNETFQNTMANVDKEKTFVFLDPPYYAQEGSGLYGRNGDTHHGFQHKEFAEFTKSIECKWLVTYDDSPRVRRLFRGCHIVPFQFDYTLAGNKSEDALAGEELLIANYDIEDDSSYDILKDII